MAIDFKSIPRNDPAVVARKSEMDQAFAAHVAKSRMLEPENTISSVPGQGAAGMREPVMTDPLKKTTYNPNL